MLKSSANQEKCYTHLSLAEREEIAIALEQGQSMRSIAQTLGRSPSSSSREIKNLSLNKSGEPSEKARGGENETAAFMGTHRGVLGKSGAITAPRRTESG